MAWLLSIVMVHLPHDNISTPHTGRDELASTTIVIVESGDDSAGDIMSVLCFVWSSCYLVLCEHETVRS